MRNFYYIPGILFCALVIFSCKKGEVIGGKTHAALINGKWLVYQQHTMIYDLTTTDLVKDTTIAFASNSAQAWYEIYNADGTSYITTMPYKIAGSSLLNTDTTSYSHFTVLGSTLTIKQNGGGTESDPITSLTDIDLGLERIYQSTPKSGWGLDVNTAYKFMVNTSYTRQ